MTGFRLQELYRRSSQLSSTCQGRRYGPPFQGSITVQITISSPPTRLQSSWTGLRSRPTIYRRLRHKKDEDGRCVVPCDPRGRGGYVAVGHCKICRTQDTGTVAAHTHSQQRLSKRSETSTTSVRDQIYVASPVSLKPVKI
jgi:hypothetical protein